MCKGSILSSYRLSCQQLGGRDDFEPLDSFSMFLARRNCCPFSLPSNDCKESNSEVDLGYKLITYRVATVEQHGKSNVDWECDSEVKKGTKRIGST